MKTVNLSFLPEFNFTHASQSESYFIRRNVIMKNQRRICPNCFHCILMSPSERDLVIDLPDRRKLSGNMKLTHANIQLSKLLVQQQKVVINLYWNQRMVLVEQVHFYSSWSIVNWKRKKWRKYEISQGRTALLTVKRFIFQLISLNCRYCGTFFDFFYIRCLAFAKGTDGWKQSALPLKLSLLFLNFTIPLFCGDSLEKNIVQYTNGNTIKMNSLFSNQLSMFRLHF